MNQLIIISGPTATGKTSTSILLAQMIKRELNKNVAIVNFDSLLFYSEISIGSAKPDLLERQGIPHYMIDIESIKSPMNAAQFIKRCEKTINELFSMNSIVILVGGSAFYLRALLKGMYQSSEVNEEIKNKLATWFTEEGIVPFIEYLKLNDPHSLQDLHPNDHYRIMRAVEHFESTGTKISDQKKILDDQDPYDFTQIIHPWKILHLYLDIPKEEHFEIIMKRTHSMMTNGLLEEIQNLKLQGFSLEEKPLSSIGYKEAIAFLKGEFKSLDECIERISISTRQLAKSQRTFFKKINPKECFNPLLDQDKISKRVSHFLGKTNES